METYCDSYNKNNENENSRVRKTKQNTLLLLSNCVNCGTKKTFIKQQELHNFNNISNDWFKMNKIINKYLLTGDKFMPEMHLKQQEFTYSACGPFTRLRERNAA